MTASSAWVRRASLSVLAVALLWPGSLVAAPPRGRLLFLRCASCHDISPSPSPKTGPNLLGVYGRKAGSLPAFGYSPAMKAQTFVWDDANLDRWLQSPSRLVPGTAMAFEGMPKPADRKALIAYLRRPAG